MRPSGSGALDLAADQKFGVSGDDDGWIWLRSEQTELLIGEDVVKDLVVISTSFRILYVTGGVLDVLCFINISTPFRKKKEPANVQHSDGAGEQCTSS